MQPDGDAAARTHRDRGAFVTLNQLASVSFESRQAGPRLRVLAAVT